MVLSTEKKADDPKVDDAQLDKVSEKNVPKIEKASRFPTASAFRQQRLAAWQPILTPRNTITFLMITGILFIPLGAVFLVVNYQVDEITMDYTNCLTEAGVNFTYPSGVSDFQWRLVPDPADATVALCQLQFDISGAAFNDGPVYMYYQLTNFYQNHRLYVKSLNSEQLSGSALPYSQLASCDPLQGPSGFDALGDQRPVYYPCGLVANSFFNDTINAPQNVGTGQALPFTQDGIAWPSDLNSFSPTQYTINGTPPIVAPPFWRDPAYILPNGSYFKIPDLSQNQRFIVWMRTASLPNFRKLYAQLEGAMPSGTYQISIHSEFAVTSFGGTKAVVLSTASFLGGKNYFLPIAYMVVGFFFVLLGLLFLVRHMLSPRVLADPKYLSWNQVPKASH